MTNRRSPVTADGGGLATGAQSREKASQSPVNTDSRKRPIMQLPSAVRVAQSLRLNAPMTLGILKIRETSTAWCAKVPQQRRFAWPEMATRRRLCGLRPRVGQVREIDGKSARTREMACETAGEAEVIHGPVHVYNAVLQL